MNYRIEHYPDALATVTSIVWYNPLSYQQQTDLTEAIEAFIDNDGVCPECTKKEDEIEELQEHLNEATNDCENLDNDNTEMKVALEKIQKFMPASLMDISVGEFMTALKGIQDALEDYSG
jgi:hypothetical protein